MQISKHMVQALACGMIAVAVTPSALAKAQPGFYLGISGGQSSVDIAKEDVDDIILDAFSSVGAPVITGTSTFEDSDTSISFLAGYRFLPYVAVEASYINLGTAEYRSSGRVNPPGPVTSAASTANMDIEVTGFTLAGIGSLPIGEVFDLHARLGFFVAKTEISASVTIGSSPPGNDTDSTDSVSALYGVGAAFHFGEHWSVSADWTRYANVGDADEDEDFETEEGFDVDALSVSVMFKF